MYNSGLESSNQRVHSQEQICDARCSTDLKPIKISNRVFLVCLCSHITLGLPWSRLCRFRARFNTFLSPDQTSSSSVAHPTSGTSCQSSFWRGMGIVSFFTDISRKYWKLWNMNPHTTPNRIIMKDIWARDENNLWPGKKWPARFVHCYEEIREIC